MKLISVGSQCGDLVGLTACFFFLTETGGCHSVIYRLIHQERIWTRMKGLEEGNLEDMVMMYLPVQRMTRLLFVVHKYELVVDDLFLVDIRIKLDENYWFCSPHTIYNLKELLGLWVLSFFWFYVVGASSYRHIVASWS